MEIQDFLPKYPNITKSGYDALNPYEDDFYNTIFHKQEFYDEKLPRIEEYPSEQGLLMKHQKLIARFLSSYTPYDSLLLLHEMGTGKTCAAIGAIEQIKRENGTIDGAVIVASQGLLNNFEQDLLHRCTAGEYVPDDFEDMSVFTQKRRVKKSIGDFYELLKYNEFYKNIARLRPEERKRIYSNKVIVIDEVHHIRKPVVLKNGTVRNIYKKIFDLLHEVTNCKILLLSGTPMVDDVSEIASVMNLILPLDQQLPTGQKFRDQFLDKDPNFETYTIKTDDEIVNRLKLAFKGRVSYISAMKSEIKQIYLGRPVGKLKHFNVLQSKMSQFQSENYYKALKKDIIDRTRKKKDSEGKMTPSRSAAWDNSLQASLAVYPDGSWGKAGETKYIESYDIKIPKKNPKSEDDLFNIVKKYKLTSEFKLEFKNKSRSEIIEKIRKFSVKYADTIQAICDAKDQSCFVYCFFVNGSGLILFSKLLELCGFSSANGTEKTHGLRYGLLAGTSATQSQQQNIKKRFNESDNIHGKFIKVIIGSSIVSEGFSFYNVQQEFILSPHWNYSKIAQAIARGIRFGSHELLLDYVKENGLDVPSVNITRSVAMPSDEVKFPIELKDFADTSTGFSLDLYMYQISEDKDISINKMIRLIMMSAFDCSLAYNRNRVYGVDGSQECNYMNCDYECDGINMDEVYNGINLSDLDYSTYQLYYIHPTISIIRTKLERVFKISNTISLQKIFELFDKEYSLNELRMALGSIQTNTIDYAKFKQLFSRSPVKKIMNIVEDIFQIHFVLHLEEITKIILDIDSDLLYNKIDGYWVLSETKTEKSQLRGVKLPTTDIGNDGDTYIVTISYTQFEILTTLRSIIDKNIPIRNTYGFISYLREENNIYFLVNSLSVIEQLPCAYYTINPNIKFDDTFDDIVKNVFTLYLPHIIETICKTTDKKQFRRIMTFVPLKAQELFLESAYVAQEKKIETSINIRNMVIEYFANYIVDINGVIVSSLLEKTENILRCYDTTIINDERKITDMWTNCSPDIKVELSNHNNSILEKARNNKYGYYGTYNITKDIFRIIDINEEKSKIQNKKTNTQKIDYNLIRTGLKCGTGAFNKARLINMLIFELPVTLPTKYLEDVSRDNLIKKSIDSYDKWKTYLISQNSKKTYMEIINEYDDNKIKRIIYFSTSRQSGGLGTTTEILCNTIRDFFDTHDLLLPHTETVKKKPPIVEKHKFIIQKITESNIDEYTDIINKELTKPTCYGKKYILETKGFTWYIIKKNKIIGIFSVDNNNIIGAICFNETLIKDTRKRAILEALKTFLDIGQYVTLIVDKISMDSSKYKKILEKYINMGFTIFEDNDTRILLRFTYK
jgi:superfamily II DNA or RNA helicase